MDFFSDFFYPPLSFPSLATSKKMCYEKGGNSAAGICHIPHIWQSVKEYYGVNSFLYLGLLSREHHREWDSPKKTSKRMVTESRRRISALVRDPNRLEGNLLLTQCMRAAARVGDIEGVKRVDMYARKKRLRLSSGRVVSIIDAAARSGSIILLKYLVRRCAIGKSTMMEAIHSGKNSVEVVTWLMENKCSFDDEVEVEAAKIGNLEVLKVFSERNLFPGFAQRVMTYSGVYGSIEVVRFLEEWCNLSSDLFSMAALKGHLELVKYLKSQGCPWDDRVTWMAAYNGHLELLDWARSRGCPWTVLTITAATHRRKTDVLEYARVNNCPTA